MPKLIILGSSNAVADEKHENTHMALVGDERILLVDCVGTPIVRLRQAGIDFNSLTDVILTHFHPDHVSGVPLLLMDMWLLGRKRPLHIYGLHHTLSRLEDLMEFYDWSHWPHFFPVVFHHLPGQEMLAVLECADFRVYASPVRHLLPTIGLRIEFIDSGKVLAYSCDTEPCPEVVKLAAGADVLIHEAAGLSIGHSSASQAGAIAREAEVGQLYLIHYPTGNLNPAALINQASETFGGPVALAEDFMQIHFDPTSPG
jgi:ribonuclease Z